jgi:glycerol-3-phosphate cytidylyltransferase
MKTGYAIGVYDMFHIGHLNLLRRAKEHCDSLIVGIKTDELVESSKGKIPIVPFAERCEIVGALKCVDSVVPHDNENRMTAWEKHRFNVLFAGDDWKGKPEYEKLEKQLANVGVEIVYFPYTQSTSSTQLRQYLERVIKDNESAILVAQK